jgi:sulfopyruvate decarboxylase TPP-binding subunit
MFDKAKAVMQIMKLKKEIESVSYGHEENGISVDVGGFMAMGEPKIKSLVVNGVENKALIEALNKALKKAAEGSMKKMKDNGDQLQGMM